MRAWWLVQRSLCPTLPRCAGVMVGDGGTSGPRGMHAQRVFGARLAGSRRGLTLRQLRFRWLLLMPSLAAACLLGRWNTCGTGTTQKQIQHAAGYAQG